MIKIKLAAAVVLVLAAQTANAQIYSDSDNPYDNPYGTTQDSPRIYAPDGKYLGNLNSNQYDPNSVANPYGRYGSPYSPDSINNPYGQYGNPYSPNSVNNPYGQ
jgi:hypothetical protein